MAPSMVTLDEREVRYYRDLAQNLKRTLVFGNGLSPIGLLRSCLVYAQEDRAPLGQVFDAVADCFALPGDDSLLAAVTRVNGFRNSYVAHQEKNLTDAALAERHLRHWVASLVALHLAP